jgi:hypothetical protein
VLDTFFKTLINACLICKSYFIYHMILLCYKSLYYYL